MTTCTDLTKKSEEVGKKIPIEFIKYITIKRSDSPFLESPYLEPFDYKFIDKIAEMHDGFCIVEAYDGIEEKGTTEASKYIAKWNDGVAE